MYPDYEQTRMEKTGGHSSSTSSTQSQGQWFDTVLQRIGDGVTADDYLAFGLKLGVPREMSENIRLGVGAVFPDVTIALLHQWMRKLGFSPEQLADELVKALQAVQLAELAFTLQEEIKNNGEEWGARLQPNNSANTLSQRLESQIVASEESQETDGRGPKSVDNGLNTKRRRKPKANYLVQPPWKFY